jgi:hypothetical protein
VGSVLVTKGLCGTLLYWTQLDTRGCLAFKKQVGMTPSPVNGMHLELTMGVNFHCLLSIYGVSWDLATFEMDQALQHYKSSTVKSPLLKWRKIQIYVLNCNKDINGSYNATSVCSLLILVPGDIPCHGQKTLVVTWVLVNA